MARLIYLKVPKTGGSSTFDFFKQYFAPSEILIPENETVLSGPSNRLLSWSTEDCRIAKLIVLSTPDRIIEFKDRFPDIWKSSHKFATVRDPYERTISSWKYCITTKNRLLSDCLTNPPLVGQEHIRSYHDYLHFTLSQSAFLVQDGVPLYDELISLENLKDGLEAMCKRVGISVDMTLLKHLHSNPRKPKDIKPLLTPEIITAINARYRDDFKYLQYQQILL